MNDIKDLCELKATSEEGEEYIVKLRRDGCIVYPDGTMKKLSLYQFNRMVDRYNKIAREENLPLAEKITEGTILREQERKTKEYQEKNELKNKNTLLTVLLIILIVLIVTAGLTTKMFTDFSVIQKMFGI